MDWKGRCEIEEEGKELVFFVKLGWLLKFFPLRQQLGQVALQRTYERFWCQGMSRTGGIRALEGVSMLRRVSIRDEGPGLQCLASVMLAVV
jgi:hypothetical protein